MSYTDLIENLMLAWSFHISDNLIFHWIVEFQSVHTPCCFNPTIFVNLFWSSPLRTSSCINRLLPLSEDLSTWIVRKNPRPVCPFVTSPNIALSQSHSSATSNSLDAFHFLHEQTSMPTPATFVSLDDLFVTLFLFFFTLNSSIKLLGY